MDKHACFCWTQMCEDGNKKWTIGTISKHRALDKKDLATCHKDSRQTIELCIQKNSDIINAANAAKKLNKAKGVKRSSKRAQSAEEGESEESNPQKKRVRKFKAVPVELETPDSSASESEDNSKAKAIKKAKLYKLYGIKIVNGQKRGGHDHPDICPHNSDPELWGDWPPQLVSPGEQFGAASDEYSDGEHWCGSLCQGCRRCL